VEIRGKHGFIGRVDFLWRQFRTIAEVDGALKCNADPMRAHSQLQRDKELRSVGYEVEHFDWSEITQGQQEVGSSRLPPGLAATTSSSRTSSRPAWNRDCAPRSLPAGPDQPAPRSPPAQPGQPALRVTPWE
jgi:Protein of unknown function (DUF559)